MPRLFVSKRVLRPEAVAQRPVSIELPYHMGDVMQKLKNAEKSVRSELLSTD